MGTEMYGVCRNCGTNIMRSHRGKWVPMSGLGGPFCHAVNGDDHVPMTPQERVAQGVAEGPVALVALVVHYQRMGDGSGADWAYVGLSNAEREGDVEPWWRVLGEWQQGWVKVVLFTFRVYVPASEAGEVPTLDALARVRRMAARIVGEGDVQVLGLALVES